ncbi:PAS domain S-box protein [Maridesulfovibrio sp.]|uniref:PAS domain S-box protein n=1 Tax=Maridesulfovibrio sp. TaxID=2795000 RepID=UPI0029C9C188|nr:PAS domain S-box protein [Maridesulfovibrio sp.]
MIQIKEISRNKTFLFFLVPTSFFLVGIAAILGVQQDIAYTKAVKLEEKNIVMSEKRLFEATLATYLTDIATTSDVLDIRIQNAVSFDSFVASIETVFLLIAKNNPLYDQIRFLDASGMERVRINRTRDGRVVTVSKEELQNKSKRPYFHRALETAKGIYISRFDLNIENGEIEQPYNPVIRLSSPIKKSDGTTIGVVVMNVKGGQLLEQLEKINFNSNGDIYLINEDGQWLKNPNPKNEWLFMLETSITTSMPLDFPLVWNRITENNDGQIHTDYGLFSYATVAITDIQKNHRFPHDKVFNDENWIIISIVPEKELHAGWWGVFPLLLLLILLLSTVLSFILADYRIKRLKFRNEVERKERQLTAITETVLDAIIMTDSSGRALFWNKAAERIFGFYAHEVLGKNIHNFIAGEEDLIASGHGLAQFAKTGKGPIIGVKREVVAKRKDGSNFPAELHINAVQIDSHWWAVGVVRDITDWKSAQQDIIALNEDLEQRVKTRTEELETSLINLDRREKLSNLLVDIASIANTSQSVDDAFEETLRLVCQFTGWPVGHVFTYSTLEDRLLPTNIWSISNPNRFERFISLTRQSSFVSGQGLPGRVYKRRQPLWIENVTRDKDFSRSKALEEVNVRAAFAFPLFKDNAVMAVLEFYSENILKPDHSLLDMAKYVGHHLGHVMERKRIEDTLKNSEQKFRSLFDQSFQLMWVLSPDGRILEANKASLKLIQLVSNQLIGDFFWDGDWWQEPNKTVDIRKAVEKASSGEFVRMEITYNDTKNAKHTIDFSITPSYDEQDNIIYLIAEGRDVTSFKQLESEADLLAKVAQKTTNGIVITDREGYVEWINQAFSDISGYSIEELVGKKPGDLLQGDNTDSQTVDIVNEALRKGEGITVEILNYSKTCRPYWVDMDIQPIKDQDGIVNKFIAVESDITERKRVSQALIEFKTTLDQINDAVFIFDPSSLLFTYVNQGATAQLEYTREEMLSLRITDINPELSIDRFKNMVDPLVTGDENNLSFETMHETKTGLFKPVHILLQYVHENNLPPRFVAVVRDIAEQKRITFELKEAKDIAEAATVAKSRFLANMSHEIRTPMNAVIGMSHILVNSELTSKQKSQVLKIQSAATSLLEIINDILDFSKIEAEKIQIEMKAFDLDTLLTNTIAVLRDKAEEKGLEIIFDIDLNIPRCVIGDPLRLSQVFTNLISNAIKFTKEGHILIKIETVPVDKKNKKYTFSIADTGIGIPYEAQQELFKPFSQVDASTTRKYGGTGLGLAICKNLIQLMGGKLQLKSTPGEGSQFFFSIELELASDDFFSYEPVKRLEGLDGSKILIIDNNELYWPIYEQTFLQCGFSPEFSSSRNEGMEMLFDSTSGKHFDILLLSLDLPDNDGPETLHIVSSDHRTQNLTVITITAFPSKYMLDESTSFDLTKPISQSSLYDATLQKLGKPNLYHASVSTLEKDQIIEKELLAGAKILVVEDNVLNQEVAKELLEAVQISVYLASNGAEALDLLEEFEYDAILMDLQMPIMGGLEATKIIRKDKRFRNLPIIAMTAHAMIGDKEKSIESGMTDHITKPIDPDVLYGTLIRWIIPSAHHLVQDTAHALGSVEVETNKIKLLNTRQGLKRVAGKRDTYLRLLKQFRDNYSDTLSNVDEAIASKSNDVALHAVHSLKGVSGNIGATALYSILVELEKALIKNSDKEIDFFIKKSKATLDSTFDTIRDFLNENSHGKASDSINLNAKSIYEKLIELSALIEGNNAESVDLAEKIQAANPSSIFASQLHDTINALRVYDFDTAMATTNSILNALDVKQNL